MLGWATGDSIVSDVAKDHALLTKFFFFPAPSPPLCRAGSGPFFIFFMVFPGWSFVIRTVFTKGQKFNTNPQSLILV